MNSRFFTSKIIQTDYQQSQIKEVCSWLETNQNIKIDIKTISNKSNIILLNTEDESIKIKTIRELKEKLAYASYNPQETQFVILLSAEKATHSAQNALLKTIEEPPENTQILLVTQSPTSLLPTINSRCQLISVQNTEMRINQKDSELDSALQILLSSNLAQKIEFAENYKDRDTAIAFCNKIVIYIHSKLKTETNQSKKSKLRALAQKLITAIELLQQNTNVRLTLEATFLSLE